MKKIILFLLPFVLMIALPSCEASKSSDDSSSLHNSNDKNDSSKNNLKNSEIDVEANTIASDLPPPMAAAQTNFLFMAQVIEVDGTKDKLIAKIRVVNLYPDKLSIKSDHNFLVNESGNEDDFAKSNSKEIFFSGYSTSELTIEFNKNFDSDKSLDFTIPPIMSTQRHMGGSVVIENVPFTKGKKVVFASIPKVSRPLEGVVGGDKKGNFLILHSMTTTDVGIEFGYEILNSGSKIEAYYSSLTDNKGNKLLPFMNRLHVDAGSKATGVFRFAGPLDYNADSAILELKTEGGPILSVEVPLGSLRDQSKNVAVGNIPYKTSTLPKDAPLDIKNTNPSQSVIIHITGISYDYDHITLKMESTNTYNGGIVLAYDGIILKDDLGNVYNINAIPSNKELEIAIGQKVEYELVFMGQVNPNVKTLTLQINNMANQDKPYYPTVEVGPIVLER